MGPFCPVRLRRRMAAGFLAASVTRQQASADIPMVTQPAPEAGIPLKDIRHGLEVLVAMAGLGTLILLVPAVAGLARGDWTALFWIALPAGIVAAVRAYDRFAPEVYVVLFADRMEFPRWRGKPRLVRWSDVEAVRWPGTRAIERRIEIAVPKSTDWPLAKAPLDLQNLSVEDRLLLIRYLRLHAAEVCEEGWPQFCWKGAVPLVAALREWETDGGASERPLVGEFLNRHPFVLGLICPLIMPRFVLRVVLREVSRETWWTTAGLIALSVVVNIRLVWGRWVSPFSEVLMGTAAAMALAGLFAPADRKRQPDEISWLRAVLCLAMMVVGLPLLGNAVALGWLRIPEALAEWIAPAILLMFLWPALGSRVRARQRQKEQAPALETDALRRWDAYIETGELPPAADAPAV